MLVGGEAREAAGGDDGVGRQEGRQVGAHADGAHARAAAAVRDAEGLVQVQVAHIRPDEARARQAHLRGSTGGLDFKSGHCVLVYSPLGSDGTRPFAFSIEPLLDSSCLSTRGSDVTGEAGHTI